MKVSGTCVVLVLLGLALWLSNPWFTFIDDETAFVSAATRPASETVKLFAFGVGQFEHPPAHDLILHLWIRFFGAHLEWVRVPAIAFFITGLWVLSRAARRIGGRRAEIALVVLGALWPLAFHFARLAAWYSFAFLCVSLLTLAYCRVRERPTRGRFLAVVLAGVLLLYTNYYGWAILACLALDDVIDHPAQIGRRVRPLAAGLLLLCLAFLPLVPAFVNRLEHGVGPRYTPLGTVLYAGFNAYSLFVSESVAPWFLLLSIPAALAIATVVFVVLFHSAGPGRRFFVYALLVLGGMAVLGIVNPRRLLWIGPWLLLPISLAIAQSPLRAPRKALVASLAVIAVVGWFGILSRTHYAAVRFVEPWAEVAGDIAARMDDRAIVIGNNNSFFFYLTYALRDPQDRTWRFPGMLTMHASHPRVFDVVAWLPSERRVAPRTLLVRGSNTPPVVQATLDAQRWLDSHCTLAAVDRRLAEPASALKRRFYPDAGVQEYRIEIREYQCERRA